jgi:hypothetical protein
MFIPHSVERHLTEKFTRGNNIPVKAAIFILIQSTRCISLICAPVNGDLYDLGSFGRCPARPWPPVHCRYHGKTKHCILCLADRYLAAVR